VRKVQIAELHLNLEFFKLVDRDHAGLFGTYAAVDKREPFELPKPRVLRIDETDETVDTDRVKGQVQIPYLFQLTVG